MSLLTFQLKFPNEMLVKNNWLNKDEAERIRQSAIIMVVKVATNIKE